MNNSEAFLEHYGTKGMTRPVDPKKLSNRVYRVAKGTDKLKASMQKARQQKASVAAKRAKDLQNAADVARQNGSNPVPKDTVPEEEINGEDEALKLLSKCGTMKVKDIG